MSIVITKVNGNTVSLVADTGFSDDTSRWSDLNTLKFIPHTAFDGKDVIVAITGSAAQLNLMRGYLAHLDKKSRPIEGTHLGLFHFIKGWNTFCSKLGVMNGPDVESSFSHYHVIADGSAWSIQGYFITQITDWETMGSGDPYARAAMALGHTLPEAASVACKYDLYCDGPIASIMYDLDACKALPVVIYDCCL